METLEINVKDKPCKVAMEELTFGKRNEALRKATVLDIVGQKINVDSVTFGEWRIVFSIKEMELVGWKHATSDEAKLNLIRGLPLQAGDALSRAEQKLNLGVSHEEGKKNSNSGEGQKDTA